MSLNICGIGETQKVDWVRKLRRTHNLSLIGLHEIKLGDSSPPINVANCWGDRDFGFEQVFSTGRSGGLITIWDSRIFSVEETLKSRYYIVVLGRWAGIDGITRFVNVYGPKSNSDKARVWGELLAIKQSRSATWIFKGDFNVVRRPEERVNSIFCAQSADSFNQFIRMGELCDLKMGGQRFTYFKVAGEKLSKLDRFLVCENFLNVFPLASCNALCMDFSDHSPIILQSCSEDFGPPPFKIFNSWILRAGYEELVKSAWTDFVGYGAPDAYLLNKLKSVKQAIRNWRSIEYQKETGAVEGLKKRMMELESIAEQRPLSMIEMKERAIGGIKLQSWRAHSYAS